MTTSKVVLRATLAGALFAGLVPGIRAQLISRVNPQATYVETFGDPKVSAISLLVGLAWSPPKTSIESHSSLPFNPDKVSILLSSAFQNRKACVEISSQDGRYFAQNLYQLPDRPGTGTFDAPSQHAKELHNYTVGEMAVSIRLVDDCNSADRSLRIPARITPDISSPALVAHLNADAQHLTVSLRKKGTSELISSICEAAPERNNISFSSSCTFTNPAPDDYDLVVEVQEGFSSRKSVFKVSLR